MRVLLHIRQRGHVYALALVCLAAFLLRMHGINWPRVHPDEGVIGGWLAATESRPSIGERVYANGFFQLARVAQVIARGMDRVQKQAAYFRGAQDELPQAKPDQVMVARWFNVWTGTVICLLIYLLVQRATRSRCAGVWAAALMALMPLVVEHCHYAETDIAMLFVFSLASWLWLVACDTRRGLYLISAALATGFAAGTKFQLILLAALIPIFCFQIHLSACNLRGIGRSLAWTIVALAIFAAGFALANPAVLLKTQWFLSDLAYQKSRVFRETALNLGEVNGPLVKRVVHLRQLADYLGTLGWIWLFLAAGGMICVWQKAFRRLWPWAIAFPAVYTWYWIVEAPWVRSQEFLCYLPSLVLLASLPMAALWQSSRRSHAVFAALMMAGAVVEGGVHGLRMASVFGWSETRQLARDWLGQNAPAGRVYAYERYATPAVPSSASRSFAISKIEADGLAHVRSQGADYLLRSPDVRGRGLVNLLTGERYPRFQKKFDEFSAHSELLRSWETFPPSSLATFVSGPVQLYGLMAFNPSRSLDLPWAQPAAVVPEYKRETFFPVGAQLGSGRCLLVDSRPRVIAIGGPDANRKPVYLVFNTLERGANIRVTGLGVKRRIQLAPYGVGVVELTRPWWKPRLAQFEKISIRAEKRKNVLVIPCYVRVAFKIEEVARIMADLGQYAYASRLLDPEDDAPTGTAAQRYVMAVRAERWELAWRMEPHARKWLADIERALVAAPETLSVNGSSSYYYNEFARCRLTNVLEVGFATNRAEFIIPVRLARGVYEAVFDVNTREGVPFNVLLEDESAPLAHVTPEPSAPWTSVRVLLPVGAECEPRLTLLFDRPAMATIRNVEVRWDLASVMDATHSSLLHALAAHALQKEDHEGAAKLIERIESKGQAWNDLEIRQLRLEALLKSEPQNAEGLKAAAARLLELAPGNAVARKIMDLEPTQGLPPNLESPLVFNNLVALSGFYFDASRREVQCLFEGLRNDVPQLDVAFWLQHKGNWRRRQAEPIVARARMSRGERVAVTVVLGDAFGPQLDPRSIALSVMSHAPWVPDNMPVQGRHEARITLSELLDRSGAGSKLARK